GYAINPARDLGPRLLAWAGGWGELAMPGNGPWFSGYFWIPIVGPLVGGVIGILVYDLFVGDVLHARAIAADEAEVGRTTPHYGAGGGPERSGSRLVNRLTPPSSALAHGRPGRPAVTGPARISRPCAARR